MTSTLMAAATMPPIQFPGLGFQVEVQRAVFSGFPVQWYGVCIAVGFLLAALYAMKRAPQFGIKETHLTDMLFWVVPAAIIGARAYYVIFDWSIFRLGADGQPLPTGQLLLKIVKIWEGGLAIYGAVILAVIAAIVYCRIRKINARAMLDLGALGLLIGQGIGRWGNFFNQEVYGVPTDLPWRMGIEKSGAYTYVHPLFFYESMWCLLGFVVLHLLSKRRKYNGQTFLQYLAWYGAGRAFFESIRDDGEVLKLFGTKVPVSMALGIALAAVSIALLLYNRFRDHDPAKIAPLTAEEKASDVPIVVEDEEEFLPNENTPDDTSDDVQPQEPMSAPEETTPDAASLLDDDNEVLPADDDKED